MIVQGAVEQRIESAFIFRDSGHAGGVGSHNRVTMMEMGPWEELTRSKTVAIEYVRSDPSLFRLTKGEDPVGFSYFWLIGLIASLLFGAGTVFTFLGYDLKTKGGVFQVTRWGVPLDD